MRIGGRRISGCAHASDFAVADQNRSISNRPGARSGSVSEGQRASNSQYRSITTAKNTDVACRPAAIIR